MAENTTPAPTTPAAGDPTGQPDPATQVKDAEAVLAKNRELLAKVAEMNRKLAKVENDEKKAADKKLEEEGKVKELLASREKELAATRDRVKRANLSLLAVKAELLDPEYVDVLMKRVEFNESDQPTNADAIFGELKTSKPFLFKQPDGPPAPGTSNAGSAGWTPGHAYTRKELEAMDPATLEKNWPEIQRQDQLGLIK